MQTTLTPLDTKNGHSQTNEGGNLPVFKGITRTISAIGLSLICICAHAQSESRQSGQISIPVGSQSAASSIQLPAKHLSSDSVKQQFGEPVTVHPAVGTPPITRWDYPQFSVYFEYGHVIHAVKKP
jgi:hypothetical protein